MKLAKILKQCRVDKPEHFRLGDYDLEVGTVVADLARFTGLTPKYIEETNLRISPFRWFKELERDKRRTVGRLDSRFEGMDVDAAGERPERGRVAPQPAGLLTRGALRSAFPAGASGVRNGASPLTAAGPCRICTGFP